MRGYPRQTGRSYRLPSEEEWKYAARAGNDKAYSWGGEIGKGRRPASNRRRVNAMLTIPRRQFLIGSALPALVSAMKARAAEPADIVVQDGAVQLRSDGSRCRPPITPACWAGLRTTPE
jgi:hypothetical protein